MGVPEVSVECSLPPVPGSAARARQLVRETLELARATRWVEDAALALSEIVTNALVHAATQMHVRVTADPMRARVEVRDASPHLPVRRDYSTVSGTGRGLHLVSELADDWGAFAEGEGKVVWFEMRDPGAAQRNARPRAAVPADAGDTVTVELCNFPLLLHLAWQEHAAALLREYLLVHLDEDEAASLVRHAEASDAMNLLYEQVPALELAQDPQAIMSGAVEPHVSTGRLTLTVPRTSVPHFSTLDLMLAEAAAIAEAGLLLVPPTQPEVAEMRQWICAQVRNQSSGEGPPRPWTSPSAPSGPASPPLELAWDPNEVNDSDRAQLAMNERSVIVAVSASAASFLGYHPDDLLGRRVIHIVPLRYHQAHIAGTTMHMTNGRSPLLGQRITVPVVTADGNETTVAMLVEARLLTGGHKLFVADFKLDASTAGVHA